MRLWQKIFLMTLCLTALAANSICLVLLTRNQANSLSLAGERIRTICDGAVLELGHLIQEEKEAKGSLMLTESEMKEIISKVRLNENGQLFMADSARDAEKDIDAVERRDAEERIDAGENRNAEKRMDAGENQDAGKDTGAGEQDFMRENEIRIEPLAGVFAGNPDGPGSFPFSVEQIPPEAGSTEIRLVREDRTTRIHMDTTAFWEGRFYRVEVSSDLTELFERFREDLAFCQWMCGGVSLLTAGILLCTILYLTRPLKRLEAATGQIAGGEYGYRVEVKGNDEMAELSRHMNEMAAEIEASIRRVEELARGREIFIANMAHELKTPLTSILGFADIMTIKSDMEEAERREYAAVIAAEAKRLKLLSSRLMELITIRETELALHPVNFGELTERALEVFAPVCAKRQCSVRRRLQPLWVEADEALLTSLVLNLLDNALKASAPGQEILVTLEEREGNAVLAVRDYGAGIPEAELERVTEAFYMVDKARSRSEGGSGIGLALCRTIVEAHHGSLHIESREGRGTRVCAVLPLKVP